MTIKEALIFLEQKQNEYENVDMNHPLNHLINILTELFHRHLNQKQMQLIENYLGKHIHNDLKEEELPALTKSLKKLLMSNLNVIPLHYHQHLGTSLGLALGAALGIAAGLSFYRPWGLIISLTIGAILGYFIGKNIGKYLDIKADRDHRMMYNL